MCCCCCETHNAHALRAPKHEGRNRNGRRRGRHSLLLHRPLIGGGHVLLLFNTTRTLSGPPSTGAAIAMDGGVADTARANTTHINTGR